MPIQTNRLRPWTAAPSDPVLGQSTHEFMRWIQASVNQLIGDPTPLPAPTVTTSGGNGTVTVNWSEVGTIGQQFQVQSYQVYESVNAAQPGTSQVPIAVVPTNHGGTQNNFVRAGLTDTTTRYYVVRAVSPTGVLGSFSNAIPGKASSALNPNNNPSVLAQYLKTLGGTVTINNSNTTIMSQAVTMPSTGGPFRVYVSYSLYLDTGASGQDAAFVTDGTNNFATAEVLTTGSASDYGLTSSSFSTATYANGASVTFTLTAAGNHAGSSTAHTTVGPALTGAQNSWLQIVVFASN